MKKTILLLISIMALTTCFSQQVITPALQDVMGNKEKNTLEIIVYFNDQVNLKKFDREMKAKKSTGSQRIRSLRRKLETTAKQTQDAFLKRLQGLQRSNDIHIKQKFWIRNAMLISTKPELIHALAADKAVRRIDINSGRYRIEEPVKQEPSTKRDVGATETGLEVVNTPPLWDKGYTGRNTLFLSIDTGVFTDHPAFSNRYAGNHFPLDYVWYSMRNPFPTDHSSSSHGTHTTGTVLGLEKETNDTIGMAWEAYWISSDPVSSSDSDILDPAVFMEVFEWVLDPDGNPATTSDVPDVINNSWGYDYDMALEMNSCELEEAHILEVIEAAGILCPFSAGNDGPGISTLGFPAMLAYNELNAMSVGAVNGNVSGFPIADFSSRGPTTCVDTTGSLKIKPEVSAPGVSVRSASGHDGYANLSGTSMSCPHVAGAFLLLKEAFPHLSVYELKNALYQTASDLGEPGEDNTYGKGLIDVYAAYQYLAMSNDPVPPVTDSFDVAVSFPDYYPSHFCPEHNTWAPAINLINRGQEDISEVHYHYCLNYGDTISNVTGGIGPNWGYDITLDSIELPPGYNELYLWAENPDAGREYNRFNNADVISINMVGTENYPWSENFADMQNGFRNTSWFVKNEDNERTWAVSDVNSGETRALMMDCLNYFDKGQKDHIHSPVISLPETDTIRLRFNLAYKKRMEYLFADSIRVYASTDCNSHDYPHLLYSDGGETMATVEGNTSNNHFVPETAEDWDTVDIDISNFAGEDIMLKFTSINDNGSSIYVDNVSVTGSGMFAETTDDKDVFSVYPNPARHEVKMVFENTRSNQGRISLYNMQGKIMKHLSLPAGTKTYKLQLSGIPSGIYMLRFTGKNQTSVRRLVVE